MKKVFAILMSLLLVLTFLSGCGKKEVPKTEPAVDKTVPAETPVVDEGADLADDSTVVGEDEGEATEEDNPEGH